MRPLAQNQARPPPLHSPEPQGTSGLDSTGQPGPAAPLPWTDTRLGAELVPTPKGTGPLVWGQPKTWRAQTPPRLPSSEPVSRPPAAGPPPLSPDRALCSAGDPRTGHPPPRACARTPGFVRSLLYCEASDLLPQLLALPCPPLPARNGAGLGWPAVTTSAAVMGGTRVLCPVRVATSGTQAKRHRAPCVRRSHGCPQAGPRPLQKGEARLEPGLPTPLATEVPSPSLYPFPKSPVTRMTKDLSYAGSKNQNFLLAFSFCRLLNSQLSQAPGWKPRST